MENSCLCGRCGEVHRVTSIEEAFSEMTRELTAEIDREILNEILADRKQELELFSKKPF